MCIYANLRCGVGCERGTECGAHLRRVLLEEQVSDELWFGHRSEATHDLLEQPESDEAHAVAARARRDERDAHELREVQHEQVASRLSGLLLARERQIEVRRVLLLRRARARVDQSSERVHREEAGCGCT